MEAAPDTLIRTIDDGIWYAEIPFTMYLDDGRQLPRVTYVTLLKFDKVTLVDTGVLEGRATVEAMLAAAGLSSLADIDQVVHTHAHPGHIGLSAAIQEANPDAEFYAHPLGVPWIESVERQMWARPIPGCDRLVAGDVRGVKALEDEQEIDFGGRTAKVLFTPGHSKDSICLHCEWCSLLITGDTVIDPAGPPNYASLPDLRKSLVRLSRLRFRHMLSGFVGLTSGRQRAPVRQAQLHLDRIEAIVVRVHRQTGTTDKTTLRVLEELGIEIEQDPYDDEDIIDPITRASIEQHLPSQWFF